MPKVALYNQQGERIGEIELSDAVFGIEPNEHVLYQAVIAQRANMRQGTHKTKTRGEVRGGGRKPWRQKGTGRARQGSIRAPQWVGGGVVFGPQPRSYRIKLNKKVRRLALRSALSLKVLENKLIVLDQLTFEQPKTKAMVEVLKNLKTDKKSLIVLGEPNDNVMLSARNIPGVHTLTAGSINVLDLLHHDTIVLTQDAVQKIEEVLA